MVLFGLGLGRSGCPESGGGALGSTLLEGRVRRAAAREVLLGVEKHANVSVPRLHGDI